MKLIPPSNGVAVRMYRQGHGDCFLLAFPSPGNPDPYYVMIDCGRKKGSQAFLPHNQNIDVIAEHINSATGNHLDLVILTHEHDDHLNGIFGNFEGFKVEEAWLAWTENPKDNLANKLRKDHGDQLIGIAKARQALALAAGEDDPTVRWIDTLLGLETGNDGPSVAREILAAQGVPANSGNKKSMKLIKDKAAQNRGVRFLNPGDGPLPVPGTKGVRAYVLGPPRSSKLIADEDPHGAEGFPRNAHGLSFAAAVSDSDERISPFSAEFSVKAKKALRAGTFFSNRYGTEKRADEDRDKTEVSANPIWRQISSEWLYAAESLALKLNKGINNTSLVLAFELPESKKVLLFAADAQRGNWITWNKKTWKDGDQTITAKDLLARTVLYKVGHHGSHNATLNGKLEDAYPNLSWMAQGRYAAEFTAMITAVRQWALTKNVPPWNHPLPSIREELLEKTQGRVFQTDTVPVKPANISDAAWDSFKEQSTFGELFFDFTILDE